MLVAGFEMQLGPNELSALFFKLHIHIHTCALWCMCVCVRVCVRSSLHTGFQDTIGSFFLVIREFILVQSLTSLTFARIRTPIDEI